MARGQTNKLYRTFVKGLITEAGFLTYPEDASTDELNTVLYRKGNRTRRLGVDFEPESTGVDYGTVSTDDDVVSEHFWKAPGNESGLNFLVVQVGSTLHFFDTSITPVSEGKKSFTVNLLTYKSPTATTTNVSTTRAVFASGKGYLFVANEYIEPLTVEYNADTDTITTTKVIIQIRDFDGVDDGLAVDFEPPTLSKEHFYNLRNQGWVTPGTRTTSGTSTGGITTNPPVRYNPYTGETRPWDGTQAF